MRYKTLCYINYYKTNTYVVDSDGKFLYHHIDNYEYMGTHENEYVWDNELQPVSIEDDLMPQENEIIRTYGITNCYWGVDGDIVVLKPCIVDYITDDNGVNTGVVEFVEFI